MKIPKLSTDFASWWPLLTSPDELARFFESQGFGDVRVHARIDDRENTPGGEDVFLTARASAS